MQGRGRQESRGRGWGEQASGGVAEGKEGCGEKGDGAGRAEQRGRSEGVEGCESMG